MYVYSAMMHQLLHFEEIQLLKTNIPYNEDFVILHNLHLSPSVLKLLGCIDGTG